MPARAARRASVLGRKQFLVPRVTKWAIEGTSHEAGASYPCEYALSTLGATYQNFAVGGSTTSGMTTRLTTNSAALAACDGAFLGLGAPNDLMTYGSDAAAWSAYLSYLMALKGKLSGSKVIVVRGIWPQDEVKNGSTGFNTRRAYIHAQLRAAVGKGVIDAYVPVGEHPVYDYDHAADVVGFGGSGGTGDYADGLHPTTATATNLASCATALLCLTKFIGEVGIAPSTTVSSFTWSDVGSGTRGAAYSSRVQVQGIGMGVGVTAAVNSGPGTIARGIAAAGTSAITNVILGDYITAAITASASYSTTLSSAYSIGTNSDTFDVTSEPPAAPVWTANDFVDQTGVSAATGHTLTVTAAGAGRIVFSSWADDWYGSTTTAPTATISVNGGAAQACVLVHFNGFPSAVLMSASGQECAAGDTLTVVLTYPYAVTNLHYQFAFGTNMANWTVKSESYLEYGSRVDASPNTPAAVTVAAGQTGLCFAQIANVNGLNGQTLVKQTGLTNSGLAQLVTTSTATWTPEFNSGSGGVSWVYGMAFGA